MIILILKLGHKAWLIKFENTIRSKIKLAGSRSLQAEEVGNMGL